MNDKRGRTRKLHKTGADSNPAVVMVRINSFAGHFHRFWYVKENRLGLAISSACLAETRQALPLQVYTEFLFSFLNDFVIVFYNRSKLV